MITEFVIKSNIFLFCYQQQESFFEKIVPTLIGSLLGALLGLLLLQYLRAWFIGWRMELKVTVHKQNEWTNLRIYNRSPFTMRDAHIYISVKHLSNDIATPPAGRPAFISDQNRELLYEDRIYWSMMVDGKNFTKLDIHPFERQAASFLYFGNNTSGLFGFPSESNTSKWRIFLIKRDEPYRALIKVVAADTSYRAWEVAINSATHPQIVSQPQKLNHKEYEEKLEEYERGWNK
jgi:hypothetical protein